MSILNIKVDSSRKGFAKLDTRTILILIIFSNMVIFFCNDFLYEVILMALIWFLCMCCGEYRFSSKMCICYAGFVLLDILLCRYFGNTWLIYIAVGIRFIRRVLPTGTLGSLLIQTIRVSEIMESLSRMKLPKSVTIPLTVLLRYFPSIGEDHRAIKKAMSMRGLQGGFFRHPVQSIECMYVPMMMAASRRADELSCAAVTRGIENPKQRTTLVEIGFKKQDILCLVIGLVYTVYSILGGFV
ncbi:MAG: energy-coupling factor transporter transmembrane component T [Lachnospiraceae bacterium]|nr:energy-coupling factor transporter transmembrane component T [Lachnospiraceae bacterium]